MVCTARFSERESRRETIMATTFIALSAWRVRNGKGKTVLIHRLDDSRAVRSLTPPSLFSTRDTVDFPTPLSTRNVFNRKAVLVCCVPVTTITVSNEPNAIALIRYAGKVWLTFGLFEGG